MKWAINTDKPVYLQLVEQIQSRIISGYYQLGDKLPSVRDLAQEACVNPNTMQKALAELERSGLIYTNRTSGKFITSDEELLKTLKKELAYEQIHHLFHQLESLGFKKDDIYMLVTKCFKE